MQRQRHHHRPPALHMPVVDADEWAEKHRIATGKISLSASRASMLASSACRDPGSLPAFMREFQEFGKKTYESPDRKEGLRLLRQVIQNTPPALLAQHFPTLLNAASKQGGLPAVQVSYYANALRCLMETSPETLKLLKTANGKAGSPLMNFLKNNGRNEDVIKITRALTEQKILTPEENAQVRQSWQSARPTSTAKMK